MKPHSIFHRASARTCGASDFSAAETIVCCAEQIAALKTFPLTMAGNDETVRIQSLQGGKGLMLRLTELGLNQGAELRVVQRQGGGLVVARGETRIALGGGMATKILVTAVAS